MIEAYKIAVNMTLGGDAHKKMMDFSVLVERTNRKMEAFLRSLKMVDHDFNMLSKDFRAASYSLKGMDGALDNFGRKATRVASQVNSLRASVNSLNNATGRTGGGGRNRGGQGGFDAGAAVGGLMGRYLAPAALGYGAFRLGKESFLDYTEFKSGQGKIEAMGYGDDVIKQAMAASRNIPGLSPSTVMHSYIASLMATQSPEKAAKIAPVLAKGQLSAQRVLGHRLTEKQAEDAIRAAEIFGGGDETKILSALSTVYKMVALSGGTILPSQVRQVANRNPNLTEMGLLKLEPTIQELGGERVGTGLRSGMAQLVKGQMGKPQAMSLKSYGWLGDVKYDKNGRPIGSKFGDFKFADLAFSDPEAFLRSTILPTYAKRGWTSQQDVSKHLYFDFQRTYADILNVVLKNLPKSERIAARAARIPGIEGLTEIGTKESKAMTRFSEAWKTFRIALGEADAPVVISGLNFLADFFEKTAKALTTISQGNITGGIGGLYKTLADVSTKIPLPGAQIPSIIVKIGEKVVAQAVYKQTPSQMQTHGFTPINAAYQGTNPAVNLIPGPI